MEPEPDDCEDQLFAHLQQIHHSFNENNQSSSNLIISGILTGDMVSVKQGVELVPEYVVTRSACGAYPIHLACLLGSLRIAEYLTIIMEKSALFETNEGVLSLHAAAFSGHHELCEVLVQANLASSGMKTRSGHLPEDVARLAGHAELAEWLAAARGEYKSLFEGAGNTITVDTNTASTIHTTSTVHTATINTTTTDTAAAPSPTTSTKFSSKSSPHKPSTVRSIAAKYTTPPRSPSSPIARAHINIVTVRPSPVYTTSSEDNAAIVDEENTQSGASAADNDMYTHNALSSTSLGRDTGTNSTTVAVSTTTTTYTNTNTSPNPTTNTNNMQNYVFEEFQRAGLLEDENDAPGTHTNYNYQYNNNTNTNTNTTNTTANTNNTNNTNNNYHMYNNYHTNNTNNINDANTEYDESNIQMPESLMFNLSDVLSVTAIEQRPYTTTRVNRVTPVTLPTTKPAQKSSFLFNPVSQKMDKLTHVMLNVNNKATIRNIYSPKVLGTGRPGTSGNNSGNCGAKGGSGVAGSGDGMGGSVVGGDGSVANGDTTLYAQPYYVHSTSQVGTDNSVQYSTDTNVIPSIVITTATVKSPNARNRIVTSRENSNSDNGVYTSVNVSGDGRATSVVGAAGNGSSGSGDGGDSGDSGDGNTTYVVHSGKGVTYVSPRSSAAAHSPRTPRIPRTPRSTQAVLGSGLIAVKSVPIHTLSDTFANPANADTTNVHNNREDDDVVRDIVRPAHHKVQPLPLVHPTLPCTLPIPTVPLPHSHQHNSNATYTMHNINHTTINTNTAHSTSTTANTTNATNTNHTSVWASSQEPMYSLHKPMYSPTSSAQKRVNPTTSASNGNDGSNTSGDTTGKTSVSNTTTPKAPARPITSHTARPTSTSTSTSSPRGQRTRSADAVDVLHTRALIPFINTTNIANSADTTVSVDANTRSINNANTSNTNSVHTNKEKVIIPRLNIGDGFTSNHNTFDLSTLLQPYIGNNGDNVHRTVHTPNNYYYHTNNTTHRVDNTNHSYNHNLYNTVSAGTNTSIHSAFVPSPIFRSKHNNDLLQSPAYKQRINLSQMVLTTERIVSDPHYTPPILPLPLLHTNTTTANTTHTTRAIHTPRSARYEMYTEFAYIPSSRRPKTANNAHNAPINMQNSVSIVVPSIYTIDNKYDENNVDTKSADYSTE